MTIKTKSKRHPRRFALLFVLPASLAFGGLAMAHPHGEGGPEGPRAMSPKANACFAKFKEKKLAALDTNKDGMLSPEERRAGHEARKAEKLAEYDKNKDGKLDKDERAEARRDRMIEHFEEIDTSKDAEISRAEADASCSPLDRHFDDVDTDKNGSITWTEFEAKAKERMGKRGKRMGHGRHMRGQGKARGMRGQGKARGQNKASAE